MTIQEACNLALQKHQAGHTTEAEGILRRMLAQRPRDHPVVNALGLMAY